MPKLGYEEGGGESIENVWSNEFKLHSVSFFFLLRVGEIDLYRANKMENLSCLFFFSKQYTIRKFYKTE